MPVENTAVQSNLVGTRSKSGCASLPHGALQSELLDRPRQKQSEKHLF